MKQHSSVGDRLTRMHGGRPQSWTVLALGFLALLAVSGVTAALSKDLLNQRPLDLRNHAAFLAARFEHTVADLGVPPERLVRGMPEFEHFDRGGGWYFYPYTLDLPREHAPERVAQRVRAALDPFGVEVKLAHNAGAPHLQLALNGQPFAGALVQREPAQPQADRRAAASRMVNLSIEALERAGAAVEITSGPEEHEDPQQRWSLTRLRVMFPQLPDGNRLREVLEEMLPRQDVTLILGDGPSDGFLMRVNHHGRKIMEMHIQHAPVRTPRVRVRVTEPEPGIPAMPRPAPEIAPQLERRDLPPLADAESMPAEEDPEETSPTADADESPLIAIRELKPPAGEPFVPKVPGEGELAKLALIIDDGGYGGAHSDLLLELDPRLTLAILPNTPFGTEIAQRGLERGFEIMLHMPMETFGTALRFPGEIKVDMDEEEIRHLTLDALAQIPGVRGVNNHTGSKYTQYADKMEQFMRVVQEQDLFFVDSVTVERSKGYSVAREMQLRTGKRDIFIDNSSNPEEIRRYLRKVIEHAKRHGSAIGIGHFRRNTVRVLAEELPRLESQGVELVHVSELLY